jgi:hypothetical protein
MTLIIGGPYHGQDIDMPDDKMFVKLTLGKTTATYTPQRVPTSPGQHLEVWALARLCHRRVVEEYVALVETTS